MTDDTLLQEFRDRTKDLNRINTIYEDENKDDYNKLREDLLNTVKQRHGTFTNNLKQDSFSQNDSIPKINQSWQDEIYRMTTNLLLAKENLTNELQQRTKDLENVLSIFQSTDPNMTIGQIIKNNEQRHGQQTRNIPNDLQSCSSYKNVEKDNENWENLLKNIENTPIVLPSSVNGKFGPILSQKLITELTSRNNDIQKLNNGETAREECEERHKNVINELQELAEDGDDDEIENRQQLLDDLEKNFNSWQELLGDQKKFNQESDKVRTQKECGREEMRGRIDDLQTIKDILMRSHELGDEGTQNAINELCKDVVDRHKDIEGRIEEQLTSKELEKTVSMLMSPNELTNIFNPIKSKETIEEEQKDENYNQEDDKEKLLNVTPYEAYCKNDKDWRSELYNLIRDMLGVEPPTEETPQNLWWLDKDENRKKHIDTLEVTQENQEPLLQTAQYINRLLSPNENEEETKENNDENPHTSLYMPIKLNENDELDNHHVLSTLYDGCMIGLLLDKAVPDFMDTRVLHPPDDLENPYPLDDVRVEDNVQLSLSSAQALGIPLPSYDGKDWMSQELHVPMLIALINSLHDKILEENVNMNNNPELMRLTLDDENRDMIEELSAHDWIPRWLNKCNKKKLKNPIDDFMEDLYNAVQNLEPNFSVKAPCKSFNQNKEAAAKALIDYVRNDMKIPTEVEPQDLVDGNRPLQELLASQIFAIKNGIPKLTRKERGRFKSLIIDDSIQDHDTSMKNFLNSQLPGQLRIKNLKRDLADGVVICKILDKVEPGCINWDKVRDRDKIRHKFDKMANCNHAIDACKNKLNLRLVGTGGQDLHDGNQKIIHSILWQVMRYQAIKALSSLAFNGKRVEDKDILQWANDTIQKLDDSVSKPITGFKDKQLTTGVFYIELFKVIIPNQVKDDIVFYDIPQMTDVRRDMDDEELTKKRLKNARYIMSLARREGAELFILPEDLITLESKAVLSMLASLMRIDFEEKLDEENKVKEDDDIAYELDQKFI